MYQQQTSLQVTSMFVETPRRDTEKVKKRKFSKIKDELFRNLFLQDLWFNLNNFLLFKRFINKKMLRRLILVIRVQCTLLYY